MSSLPTVLTVTGLLCCLLLVSHAQDAVDCDAEVAKCPPLNRVLTPDDLGNLCSTQADRKVCYAALPAKCQSSSLSDSLDAVDYVCQPDIENALKAELASCVMPNQQTIDDKYDACAAKIPTSASCSRNMARKCAIESYNDCCPKLCELQDIHIYNFYKSVPTTPMCPWPRISGYCNGPRKACAPPAK